MPAIHREAFGDRYPPRMAKRTSVVLSCDLPHDEPVTDGVITITLGYEGTTYTVELCPVHADEYHADLQKYVGGAAPALSVRRRRVTKTASSPRVAAGSATAHVRAWAKENGYTVPSRGRISADIMAAYEKSVGKVAKAVKRTGRKASGSTDTAAIRAWAQANGYEVGDRGRIPGDVVAAYEAAQG